MAGGFLWSFFLITAGLRFMSGNLFADAIEPVEPSPRGALPAALPAGPIWLEFLQISIVDLCCKR
jgi:hypothetical protein